MREEGRHPRADLPGPGVAWRSRFEPSAASASLTCRHRSRSRPIDASSSWSAASSAKGSVTSTRDPPVAGIEADPEPRVPLERVEDRRQLGDRATHRAAGARGVLEDQPEAVVRQLEQLPSGGTARLRPLASPAPRCEPTWKTTPSAPIAEAVARTPASRDDFLWISRSGAARLTGRGVADDRLDADFGAP